MGRKVAWARVVEDSLSLYNVRVVQVYHFKGKGGLHCSRVVPSIPQSIYPSFLIDKPPLPFLGISTHACKIPMEETIDPEGNREH